MENEVLIRQIGELEYEDTMAVLKAATKRWGDLFPDWEIITLSVPRKDVAAKKAAIQNVFALLGKEKENTMFFVAEEK